MLVSSTLAAAAMMAVTAVTVAVAAAAAMAGAGVGNQQAQGDQYQGNFRKQLHTVLLVRRHRRFANFRDVAANGKDKLGNLWKFCR